VNRRWLSGSDPNRVVPNLTEAGAGGRSEYPILGFWQGLRSSRPALGRRERLVFQRDRQNPHIDVQPVVRAADNGQGRPRGAVVITATVFREGHERRGSGVAPIKCEIAAAATAPVTMRARHAGVSDRTRLGVRRARAWGSSASRRGDTVAAVFHERAIKIRSCRGRGAHGRRGRTLCDGRGKASGSRPRRDPGHVHAARAPWVILSDAARLLSAGRSRRREPGRRLRPKVADDSPVPVRDLLTPVAGQPAAGRERRAVGSWYASSRVGGRGLDPAGQRPPGAGHLKTAAERWTPWPRWDSTSLPAPFPRSAGWRGEAKNRRGRHVRSGVAWGDLSADGATMQSIRPLHPGAISPPSCAQ